MKSPVFIAIVFVLMLVIGPVIAQDDLKDFKESFTVSVFNPLERTRKHVLVRLGPDEIGRAVKGFNPKAFVVTLNGKEIASQYNFSAEGFPGIVTVLDSMRAKETYALVIRYKKSGSAQRKYVKRTQAELSHKTGGQFVNREYVGGTFKNVTALRVPPEHKDHSWFIRYEGPGWESDKVGYRFYLDQRNATDMFGKKRSDMVLQEVGLDGFDSYHNLQPWGMDVMKVGKSLGLGSIGAWQNGLITRVEKTDSVSCRIVENGDLYSLIKTNYKGWAVAGNKYDVQSYISIHAGVHLTTQRLVFGMNMDSICTGIVKDKTAQLITDAGSPARFGYLATFGKQSLNSDALGLAVFFDPQTFSNFSGDEFSHVVTLKPKSGNVAYHFSGVWSGEPGGIKTENEFLMYVQRVAEELASPVQLQVRK
jgi:hypothetical protein